MTASTSTARIHTATDLLFGADQPQPSIDRLWGDAPDRPAGVALGHLAPILRAAARREITTATTELLHIDLMEVLVAGWRKHGELVAAARRTAASPGSTELVELATHRVQYLERPALEVRVDGTELMSIEFKLSLVFDVSVLVAAIRSARLVALHSGRCDVAAKLAIDGVDAAAGHERFDLRLVVALGNGIALLPDVQLPPDPARTAPPH
jgi:hypothetical protein